MENPTNTEKCPRCGSEVTYGTATVGFTYDKKALQDTVICTDSRSCGYKLWKPSRSEPVEEPAAIEAEVRGCVL